MAQADHKRTTMTLYIERHDLRAHWVCIALAEKGVQPNIVIVNRKKLPAALTRINPYGILPTLVDRELVLYKTHIMNEYLDERFPHPPLLPVYPIVRAKCRQMIYQIEQDWYRLLHQMENGTEPEAAQQRLKQSLLGLAPVFAAKPYFLNEEFTLVDCCIAPILWRLQQLKLPLIDEAPSIVAYQHSIFERPSFKTSLHSIESEGI
jgi:RNA polymerase-associated protein